MVLALAYCVLTSLAAPRWERVLVFTQMVRCVNLFTVAATFVLQYNSYLVTNNGATRTPSILWELFYC